MRGSLLWKSMIALAATGAASLGGAFAEIVENDVTRAIEDHAVRQVFETMNALDAAILAGDADGFAAAFTADALVNNPGGQVFTGAQAAGGFRAGMIDYHTMERHIERAQTIPGGYVVVMGEEVVTPKGKAANAGKTVRRRFTDIWREEGEGWKLAVRQATVTSVE